MQNVTRKAFNAYLGQLATLNQVEGVASKFSVAPSVQQKLETRMQESSDFLKRINMVPVDDAMGAKLGLGIGGSSASTTDTTVKARETSDTSTLDDTQYHCQQTNFDSHIRYQKLDLWAKFPDFQTRVRDALVLRQALDRITIGFNGRTRAATSDRTQNPLLQDVGIGWLQKYRNDAPARVMAEGATAGKIKVGAGGDYRNLDAVVMDAVSSLLAPWHSQNTALVAIVGSDLLHDKYFPLVNGDNVPSEQLAAQMIVSQKRIGNRMAVTVPYFPANAIFVTTFDNLSVYYQTGGRRRHIIDNPTRDRIENFESSNDDFVVEDYGMGCLIENIELVEGA